MNNQERLDMLKGEWSQGIPWAEESKKWLLWQAERVDELEAKYSRLEESFKKQTTNAFDGWEKVIELEREKEDYEQALEFYGNEGNYKTVIENDKEIKFLGTSVAQMDGGEAARKVLESSGNEGDLDE